MGYTLKIGNAEPEFSKEDGELYAAWRVKGEKHKDAPTFPNDEMTENTSVRSPSYSTWADLCRESGLYEMFFDKWSGLLRDHPGCQMLQPEHLLHVRAALEQKKRTATLPPGFEGFPKHDEKTGEWVTPDAGKYDANLARLIWLEWWIDWALKNCETPAFANS